MRWILIFGLLQATLFGYECSDSGEELTVNEVTIKKTDNRYGYKDLSCKSIDRVFDGYGKDKEIESSKIKNNKDLIIADRKIFSLKKEKDRLTIAVDIANINSAPKSKDDGYFGSIKNRHYYLLTFDKDGKYVVNEKAKEIEIINTTGDTITLSDIFESTTWFKGAKIVNKQEHLIITLLDSIDEEQKDTLKDYIKILKDKNKIVLSKKEANFLFKKPKEEVLDPLDLKNITFDNQENNFSKSYRIGSIEEFTKFTKLEENKEGHIKENLLCIDSVDFEDKTFVVQTEYCKVYENSIRVNPKEYSDKFEEKNLIVSYNDKNISWDDIKHTSKTIDINLTITEDTPFTFNKDNSENRERTKTIKLSASDISLDLYPTFTEQQVVFECNLKEIDTSGNQFREKIISNKDTKTKLTLPNGKKVICGEELDISLDKKQSIKEFIEDIKGFGGCKGDKRDGKTVSVCSSGNMSLLLAYVPFSKNQFFKRLKTPRRDISRIEEFLENLLVAINRNTPKEDEKRLFVKNTSNLAKPMKQQFKESFVIGNMYSNIRGSITKQIERVFDTKGNISLFYFSYLDKNEIRNMFCESKFDNRAVIFNFNENINNSKLCSKVKVIDIADDQQIGGIALTNKLNESKQEVIDYLKGEIE